MARDLSVEITSSRRGFVVDWRSVSTKADGRRKERKHRVEFSPSDRPEIFTAAMQRNLFGHEVQHDPMKGEPYVWARIVGDTLSVFSLFIDAKGDYEMQQYDRSLAEGGLKLVFTSHRNGHPQRRIETFLHRQ